MLGKLRVLWRNLWILAFVVALGAVIAYGFSVFAGGGRQADTALLAAGATPSAGPGTGYPAPGLTPLPTTKVNTDPALMPSPPPRTAPTVVVPDLPPLPLPTSTYISKEVVLAKRGSGPGEIGIQETPEEPWGPPSFTADANGNVYVLDLVNSRVNKYDDQGKFVFSFAFDKNIRAIDIAVWKDGSIFLADEAAHRDSPSEPYYQTVYKFDPSGKLVLTYRWYDVSNILSVRVDSSGGVWAGAISVLALTTTQLGTVDVPYDREQVAAGEKPGFVCRSGVITSRYGTSPDRKKGVVDATLNGKPLQLQLPAHPNVEATFAGSTPVDTDASGRIYQNLTYFFPGDVSDFRILVYDSSGALLDQVAIPRIPDYATPRHGYQVDEQGRVYDMIPLKDGVKIIRWEKPS